MAMFYTKKKEGKKEKDFPSDDFVKRVMELQKQKDLDATMNKPKTENTK